jgi:DNA-binding CsgD family transcriptional regulator
VSADTEQSIELSPETKRHIDRAVEVLVEEFGHHHSPETIQRIMDESVRSLVGQAQVEDFLPALAHRFTRERLKALSCASGPEHAMPDVLFIGLGDRQALTVAARLDLLTRAAECHDQRMSVAPTESSPTAAGYEALASGDWEVAREAFETAVAAGDSPEALDGLGRALWWLRDSEGAVVHRERAYSGFRRDGELARAARIALWLSREYAVVWRNDAAANGWLARAERLLADVAPGSERGWLELARSERAPGAHEAEELARSALDVATHTGDTDLELRALAQLGLTEVSEGEVEVGLSRLDEAMAAATSGDPTTLETFADVSCTLMLACAVAGDEERPKQWSQVLEGFVRRYDHVTLLAFCRTCCADVYAANGRVDAAEEELLGALRELTEAGQRARCVHPAARLAEIRVMQGRFDEAEQLLTGFEDEPEAVDATVALRLARDEPEAAATLIQARLAALRERNLLAAPLLGRLVEAELARGQVGRARETAAQLQALAEVAGRERVQALDALARGRIAAASGDEIAAELLQQAVNLFAGLRQRLETARARFELARCLAEQSPEVAIDVGKRAYNELEGLGATRETDAAAAFLRTLGVKVGSGPRGDGALSKREREVLRLLSEGHTNAEIAARLFISPKTAEHHVGRIYQKLGLRTRAEAAAFAVRNPGPE